MMKPIPSLDRNREEDMNEIEVLEKKLEEREKDLVALSDSFYMLGKRLDSFVDLSLKMGSSKMGSSQEWDEILRSIMETVDEMMKVEASSLLLLDEGQESLTFRVATGEKSEEIKRFVLRMGEGIAGQVAQERKPIIVNDASKDDRHLVRIDRELNQQTRNILCVPLIVNDRLIGVMEVINRIDGRPFIDSDMLLLATIANQAAILIDHAYLFKELQEKITGLTTLIEVSSLVNSTLELDSLLNIVMELSTKVMKAEASSLLLLDESGEELVFEITQGEKREAVREIRIPVGKGIAGWVAQHREPVLIPDVKADPRFYQGVDNLTGFVTKSVLCVPLEAKDRLLGVVEVLNKTENGPAFSEEDLKLFTALAGQSAIAIDNAMLYQSQLEKERIEQDLRTAYEVQQTLLPQACPEVHGLRVYARMNPARTIGGDYYDFLSFNDGQLGFVVADVAGKGLPSALLVNILRSILRGYLSRSDCPPSFVREIVSETNRRICEDIVDPSKFITLFFALLDTEEKTLHYSDAGHTLTILYRQETGKCEFLKTEGIVLGVDPEDVYEEKMVELAKGDMVFMYTDGLIEAENEGEELFGVERMVEIIKKKSHLGVEELTESIFRQVNTFSAGAEQKDDLTMVALEMTG